ncbi:MAG: YdcF family protein [Clostridia bacterium]|nr:YdcF family protein [Clostridia bacterium]
MAKVIKPVLILLSALNLLLYIGPFFTSGEINIGIITGTVFSAVLFITGIKYDKIRAIVKRTLADKKQRAVFIICTACVALCAIFAGAVFAGVVYHGAEAEHKTKYVIVLGCKVNGTTPGRYLNARINRAYRYLEENPGSVAVLSGGRGTGEEISEARCMSNALLAKGISSSRLILEEKSASTTENFGNTAELLADMGIKTDEITVVTNDFHQYRAYLTAAKFGLKAYSCPAKTPLIGYLPFAVREIYAIAYRVVLSR